MAEYDSQERQRRSEGTSGKAIFSLVLGLLSMTLLPCALPGLAMVLGGLALGDISGSRGRLGGKAVAIGGLITGGIGLLVMPIVFGIAMYRIMQPAFQMATDKMSEAADRMRDANNLKVLGIAMHEHHNHFNRFPTATINDKQGKPVLSWRVALLPYLENDNLYKQFKLDEPWDSPNNKRLLDLMPEVFRHPRAQSDPSNQTPYRVFVAKKPEPGKHTMFDLKNGVSFAQVKDGMSTTVMIIETEDTVPWTKPEYIEFDPNTPLPRFSGRFSEGFNVLLGDGSVVFFGKNPDERILRASIGRDDGQVADPGQLQR